jgi:hypothetical protein
MMNLAMLAQYSQDSSIGSIGMSEFLFLVFYIPFIVALIAATWRMYEKAGQPGWASIIPFYNLYVLLVIAGKPWWWLLVMLFVPIVNLVFTIMLYVALSKSFGHGVGFALGLIFLNPIFILILGFGSSQYVGADGGAAPPLPSQEPPLPPPNRM